MMNSNNSLPPCGENCGISRTSPNTREEKTYTKLGIFLILFGISSKPKAVKFYCKKCGRQFDQLSPTELGNYA
ncbi:hypothetical protein LEP1GSC034_4353 [Leptospira interrogans str. 2003000735]|nr:hypothetical protein LIC_10627 [Leptospira interrogans serovar Copenhageni str. Fiocruz L1-130]AER03642.1 hypothetical protein LIF_A2872 [Leptospira interrogans serovar Lai str. IPAV]AJR13239.1 hypothetical protein LIL_10637 [Leptospira interrogans serovar Linhai str. 56609]EJO78565.1 hypothetical protein LEP1GSC045_3064 [Leptospira interrogans serovar Pomona str. Kennewicki LC82-25]EJP03241.1 hypothetical protein LEP1GSC007_0706 [Leptospira interrogans serovar Bulgarica str. Mallika]EKN864